MENSVVSFGSYNFNSMTYNAAASASLFRMNIHYVQIVFVQVADNHTNIQFVFDV